MAKVKKIEQLEDIQTPSVSTKITPLKVQADTPDTDDESGDDNPFRRIRKYLMDRYEFRRNVIQNEIEYKLKVGGTWERVNESDLEYKLFERGFKSVKNYLNAILKSQYTAPEYNPVLAYFDEIGEYKETDGDHIKKLSQYIETDAPEYWELQFKKAMVRTVACALRIEKFNKQAIIFQGKQNDGKTSFVRFLIPEKLGSLYIANSFDPRQKDHERRLATCLIINLDEMADLSRQDANLIKSKMTLESVKMRPPYETKEMEFSRIATFWGSTNDDEFLNDPTGSSRWIIIKVKNVKHDKGGKAGYNQNVDIDKVWAQAYHLLKTGYDYKLTEKELQTASDSNKAFQIVSSEMEYLTKYFTNHEPDEVMFKSEIIDYIMAQHPKAIINQFQIGKALKYFGYEMGSRYAAEKGMSLKGYKVRKKPIDLLPVQNIITPAELSGLKTSVINKPEPVAAGDEDLPF